MKNEMNKKTTELFEKALVTARERNKDIPANLFPTQDEDSRRGVDELIFSILGRNMVTQLGAQVYLTSHECSDFNFSWRRNATKYRLWSDKPQLSGSYPDWFLNEEIGLLEVGELSLFNDAGMTFRFTGKIFAPEETIGNPGNRVNTYRLYPV